MNRRVSTALALTLSTPLTKITLEAIQEIGSDLEMKPKDNSKSLEILPGVILDFITTATFRLQVFPAKLNFLSSSKNDLQFAKSKKKNSEKETSKSSG